MSLLTRVVRMGVKADFGSEVYRVLLGEGVVERTEGMFPRGEVEKVLGDCVAGQAERREGEERGGGTPEWEGGTPEWGRGSQREKPS